MPAQKDPWNACDFDHVTRQETRLLPYGGEGNIILCYKHYLAEMRARQDAASPAWDSLKVYGPATHKPQSHKTAPKREATGYHVPREETRAEIIDLRATAAITIAPHPTSADHVLVLARTATRVYAVTYAEPFPTNGEAEALWRDDRRVFRPYDETTGRYVL